MVLNIPKLQRPFEGPHFNGWRQTQQEARVTRRTTHPPLLDRKASLSNQELGWGSRYKGEFWMGRKKIGEYIYELYPHTNKEEIET